MDTIGHPKKRAWLAAYANCGVVRRTCEAADVSHGAYYGWVKDDPQFAEAVRCAKEEFIERLEAEADRRAVEGIPRLKFHNGKPVNDPTTGQPYVEREYSDTLLIFRLKALRPKVYRERYERKVSGDEINREVERMLDELKSQYAAACPDCSCPRCSEKRRDDESCDHSNGHSGETCLIDPPARYGHP